MVAEKQMVVGVTITNMPEPAPQRVYVRDTVAARSSTTYGVADVSEENELVLVMRAPAADKYGNPMPSYQS